MEQLISAPESVCQKKNKLQSHAQQGRLALGWPLRSRNPACNDSDKGFKLYSSNWTQV